MTDADVVSALTRHLPAGTVVVDPDVMGPYRGDYTRWVVPGSPAAVVFPSTTAEVKVVVEVAAAHRTPIVPRGAGSGLAGGCAAVDGGITLSLARMNRILEVDLENQLVVAQPGVLNKDVAEAARASGLWYPPDPSSWEFSSIGGNLATNAGGLCCVKYGVTADYVLGLEVVLPDGTAVRLGRRTIKGVAGYDLGRLFVGSEGTLGVITEATLRLRPERALPATAVAFFPTLGAVGEAIVKIARNPAVSLLEMMDRVTIAAVDDWKRMDLDREAAALLLIQTDTSPGDLADVADVCRAAGASFVAEATDGTEAAMLLEARRVAYPALERLGATLLDDVAVPRAAIPRFLAMTTDIAAASGSVIGTFGHAGDGNLHPTVVFDAGDSMSEDRARNAFDLVVGAALSLGGTVTGEHGVGMLKREWLAQELGPAGLRLHHLIKDALDPQGIMNPGKILALRAATTTDGPL